MPTVRTALNFAWANEEIAADVFVDAREKITTKLGRESPVLIFSLAVAVSPVAATVGGARPSLSETTHCPGRRCRTAFHPCKISAKETDDPGDNSHEGNRCDGPSSGNGRDEAGGATRA